MWKTYLAAVGIAAGTGYQFFTITTLNVARPAVEQYINESLIKQGYDSEPNEVLWSMLVSTAHMGALVGSLGPLLFLGRFGPRKCLLANAILTLIAAAITVSADMSTAFELLFVGRMLLGVTMGMGCGVAPLFLNEISPAGKEGLIGSFYQISISFADLTCAILSQPSLLGGDTLWPILLAFPAFPALFQFLTVFFSPDSPKYLLKVNNIYDADKASMYYYNIPIIARSVTEAKSVNLPPAVKSTIFEKLYKHRQAAIHVVVAMVGAQFVAIQAIAPYSFTIFKEAGLGITVATWAPVGLTCLSFSNCVIWARLVDRFGRRFLILLGYIGVWFTFASLTLLFFIQYYNNMPTWAGYCIIVTFVMYYIFFGLSAGVPWLLMAELSPSEVRPQIATLAVLINWILGITVSLVYPIFKDAVGIRFSFLPFIVVMTFVILYIWRRIPETKFVEQDIAKTFDSTTSFTKAI